MRGIGIFIGMVLVVSLCFESNADEAMDAFESANRLYEQGEFREAAEAFESLTSSHGQSLGAYFNAGNAWFKAGELGRAVAAYRQAERIAPADPDVIANLGFVLAKATGQPPEEIDPVRQRYTGLAPSQWANAAGAFIWLWLLAMAAREFSPGFRNGAKGYVALLGAIAACLAIVAVIAHRDLDQRFAVSILNQGIARFGPLEESQVAFKLFDGQECRVQDEKDGWIRILAEDGQSGWIPASDMIIWDNLRGDSTPVNKEN